jgi:hypothetical protein
MSQSTEITQIVAPVGADYPINEGDEITPDYIMDEGDEVDMCDDDSRKKILRKMPLSLLETKPDIIMD